MLNGKHLFLDWFGSLNKPMPKPVHDLVDKLLDNPDFYPEKSDKDRESTAWAIAYSNFNKRKKQKKKSFNMKEYRTAQKPD